MALASNPTYTDLDTFKLYTPVSSQKTIIEDDWKPFALRAEKILDTYVNIPNSMKFDSDQGLKFPITDENGNSLIPDDVVLACIYITSDLILQGDPSASSGNEIASESWDGSGYSVTNQKKSSSTSSDDLKVTMPPIARRLLMPWTNKVASLKY